MKILAIDTSNKAMSVAVTDNGEVLGETTLNHARSHSGQLLPVIEQLMSQSGVEPTALDRVVVAAGPGSYTGLRIGVTTAKTLAYTLNIQLVGVSSLAVLAANVRDTHALVLPLMDARRQNVFAGGYQWVDGRLRNVIQDRHIALNTLVDEVQALRQPAVFVGADATMRETILARLGHGARFADDVAALPRGSRLAQLGTELPPIDIDSFVPRYLRVTEAERNWLQTHDNQGSDHYVEKV